MVRLQNIDNIDKQSIKFSYNSMIRSPSLIKTNLKQILVNDTNKATNKKKLQPLNSPTLRQKQKTPTPSQQPLWNDSPRNQELKKKMARSKSGNIIKHLDQKDSAHTHKYKQFKSHNKHSDFNQIMHIIEELLDKHAIGEKLSISQQYILTGYMGKYIQAAKTQKNINSNPFNIVKRLQTKNNMQNMQKLSNTDGLLNSKRKSPSRKKANKVVSVVEDKKILLSKQFERLRCLWQLYQLKNLVCPDMNKISQYNQAQTHKQMMEIIIKLKSIERNKTKVGEQKSLIDVQKVMKVFEEIIKKSFC